MVRHVGGQPKRKVRVAEGEEIERKFDETHTSC
jgi:hypothetical protein